MWYLQWTKPHWDRISPSISVSPANHSTDCSTLIIIHHHPGLVQQVSSGLSISGLGSTPPQKRKKEKKKKKKKKKKK
jgi:hypothetical protein